MISPQDYLQDPCRASSLSFRRTNTTVIPENVLILRDDEFAEIPYPAIDEPYFKLIHRMEWIDQIHLPEDFEMIQCDTADYADHIRECYDGIYISADDLLKQETYPGFDPGLRIAICERNRKKIIASGIAEYDPYIVLELLHRLQGKADFVTVSGKTNNPDHPIALYKSCGFADMTIWHIITKINIHRHSRWFFIFGHSPHTASCPHVGSKRPVSHAWLLLATRERVPRVKQT